jgi:hypothetical protein
MALSEPAADAIRHLVEEVLRRIRTEAAAAPASSQHPAAAAPASSQHPAAAAPASSQHPAAAAPASSQYPAAAAPASSQHPAPAPSAQPAGATIGERVVTLELVARLPAGTRQVTVPPRAVVTPSARDFARDKGIAIVHASASPAVTPAAAARLFVVAHADCVGDVAGRAAAIVRSVPGAWQIPPSGLADVLQAIATHASRDGARAVLLTGRPTAAVILANRHPSVRGVSGRDAAALNAAAAETAANLLVVHPRDFVGGGLERLCAGFAAREQGPVPAELAAPPVAAKPCACTSHAH